MTRRIDYEAVAPEALAAMMKVETYARHSGVDHGLLELVKTRASQINGCAYCIDMHTKDARKQGETEQRLYALSAWRETSFFTAKERAALAWTEAVTNVKRGVHDDVYREARAHFGERELVDLTMAVVAINAWNRLSIAFGTEAGTYQPGD